MRQLICEMCGGKDLIKQDGVFVCQSCGTKYSVEEAKKMMIEISGAITIANPIKVEGIADNKSKISRAYELIDTYSIDEAKVILETVLQDEKDNLYAMLGMILVEFNYMVTQKDLWNQKTSKFYASKISKMLPSLSEDEIGFFKKYVNYSINTSEFDKYTLISLIVYVDEPLFAEFLIKNGANVNEFISLKNASLKEGLFVNTLLTQSLVNRDFELTKFLLINGANPNKGEFLDENERLNPISFAIHNEDVDLLKLLIEHGANVNTVYRGYLHWSKIAGGGVNIDCRPSCPLCHAMKIENFQTFTTIMNILLLNGLQIKKQLKFDFWGDLDCDFIYRNHKNQLFIAIKETGYYLTEEKYKYLISNGGGLTQEEWNALYPKLNDSKKEIIKRCEPELKNEGCYIATCVYGSYDCPQVWTLRRYRDNTLASTWYGRAFIHTYYAVSPTIVKWFGNTQWFKKLWKNKLNKMVFNLRRNGIEDTPYQDKDWR